MQLQADLLGVPVRPRRCRVDGLGRCQLAGRVGGLGAEVDAGRRSDLPAAPGAPRRGRCAFLKAALARLPA